MKDLDRRGIIRGAAFMLASVPVIIVVNVFKSDDLPGLESNLWVIALVALLVGAVVGGWSAARDRPESPLTHGAAATGAASLLLLVVTVIRRAISGDQTHVIGLILLSCILVSLGVLGGYIRFRQHVREAAEDESHIS